MNLNDARTVAAAAPAGPWEYDAGEVVAHGAHDTSEGAPHFIIECWDGLSGVQNERTGRFIETFDPTVVAAMLDVMEAAEYAQDTYWSTTARTRLSEQIQRVRNLLAQDET